MIAYLTHVVVKCFHRTAHDSLSYTCCVWNVLHRTAHDSLSLTCSGWNVPLCTAHDSLSYTCCGWNVPHRRAQDSLSHTCCGWEVLHRTAHNSYVISYKLFVWCQWEEIRLILYSLHFLKLSDISHQTRLWWWHEESILKRPIPNSRTERSKHIMRFWD